MANLSKLGKIIPIFGILVIVAILAYYFNYFGKSWSYVSFTIEDISNLSIEKVLEFRSNTFIDYNSGETHYSGEDLIAVLPYYYNDTPYAVALVWVNKSNILDIRLYNLRYRKIVGSKTITELNPECISGSQATYYTDENNNNRTVITYYTISSMCGKYYVYKIIVDHARIENASKVVEFNSQDYTLYQAIVFEGRNMDYYVYVLYNKTSSQLTIGSAYSSEPYNIVNRANLRYYAYSIAPSGISIYETKNLVILFVSVSYDFVISVFDKKNKVLLDPQVFYKYEPIGFETRYILGGYYDDIAIATAMNKYGFASGVGYIDVIFPTDLHDFGWGFIRGNKIFQIMPIIGGDYPNYAYAYIMYRKASYTIGEPFRSYPEGYSEVNGTLYPSLESYGKLIDLISLVEGTGSGFEVRIPDRHIEVLGLDNTEYIPMILYTYERDAYATVQLLIVDMDNYIAYRQIIYESPIGSAGLEYPQPLWFAMYQPRYLIPIEEYIDNGCSGNCLNYTNIYSVYVLSTYPIVQNVTLQPQPKPQPGFGVVITPTEENITLPEYNVTQNVTTTPTYTGIQSVVIEILRRNIWVILVAILLLVLIGMGLRRRVS